MCMTELWYIVLGCRQVLFDLVHQRSQNNQTKQSETQRNPKLHCFLYICVYHFEKQILQHQSGEGSLMRWPVDKLQILFFKFVVG